MASFLWILCFFCYFFVFASNGAAAYRRVFRFPESQETSSIASNQYRTAYHFQPPKNWMNDPNGPMYYNGIYHLFYQYNPNSAVWGNITWGHSISTDLINWTPQDPAIHPSKSFDINGCWSGSATIRRGSEPAILYTGIDAENRQVQNVAIPKNLSDPFLREWSTPDYNPLMEPVDGLDPSQFRDPMTAWHGSDGHWRVAVGAQIAGNGTAVLYKSSDFVHWVRAASPLHTSKGSGMWECPDFYPVPSKGRQGLDTSENSKDVKRVLKMSLSETQSDHYMLGKYDIEKDIFVPDETVDDYRVWLRYDYGKFYASKTFFDEEKKRRISWAWLNESDTEADALLKGWAGIQAAPRTIWLDSNGRQLVQWPVKELESLRRNGAHLQNTELKTGGLFEIKGVKASQADVEVDFELPSLERAEPLDPSWLMDPPKLCREEDASVQGGLGPFGLLILASHNLEEHTAVFFRVYKAHNGYMVLLCSDQRRSSLRPEVDKPAYGSFVDMNIEKEGRISLRTLIDHSVVESFAGGGRTCITARVYPEVLVTGDIHLYAFNNGTETIKIPKLQAWDMAKPWINV
ncbi:beta-fructofuranosidase, insoluble isoenzyme 4-like [Phoenix dactylifera]|uniref:Beta-fructofuranosidase, insoluble isoenzyme 4-like n=1 Tax=Phoenix dactylifera TaxID=42345 RepID=A0A8B7BRZ3_PHODC|nr:beta-fructofuranosidase, insoluble isoenzyme 4-like [Phoenix dactylifera]